MIQESTIKGVLRTMLYGLSPPIPTVWENTEGKIINTPNQRVFFIPAEPTVTAISNKPHSRMAGIMQVSLHYKQGDGDKTTDERVQLIRDTFHAGYCTIKNGVQIVIPKLPARSAAMIDGADYVTHISIYYEAFEL